MEKKHVIVLVPGAFQDGWAMEPAAIFLRGYGYEVVVVTFPGHDTIEGRLKVSLKGDADHLVQVIQELGPDAEVTCVFQSSAGIIGQEAVGVEKEGDLCQEAASRVPQVVHVISFAAFFLDLMACQFDVVRRGKPEVAQGMEDEAKASFDRSVEASWIPFARYVLMPELPEEVARALWARLRRETIRLFTDQVTRSLKALKIRKTALLGRLDGSGAPFRLLAELYFGVDDDEIIELEMGHMGHFTAAQLFAEAIHAAIQRRMTAGRAPR